MITRGGRLIQVNQPILDQADFFEPDGFTRTTGLGVVDLSLNLFYKNGLLPWPLIDGSGVSDALVKSGSVYWNEIAGSPGLYSVRFRPNAVGYWRLLLNYTAGLQIMGQDYEVVAQIPLVESGLLANFVSPS